MEAFSVVTVLAAGAAVDAFREGGYERQGFGLLQVCAGLAGVAGFLLLRRQPDPGHCTPPPEWSFRYVVRPLRDERFRRLVVFNLLWLFGMTVCTPFLNAHLLKNTHWDFKSLAVLGLLSSLAAIAMNPVWGRLADRHGYKPVLEWCSFGLLLIPLLYALCPWGVRWPIYASSLLAGVFLSGFRLALFSLTLEGLPVEARAMGSAVMAGVAGPAVFLSGATSGWVADALSAVHWRFGGLEVANYQLLFAASMLLRLPALLLLKRIHQEGRGQRPEVSRQESA